MTEYFVPDSPGFFLIFDWTVQYRKKELRFNCFISLKVWVPGDKKKWIGPTCINPTVCPGFILIFGCFLLTVFYLPKVCVTRNKYRRMIVVHNRSDCLSGKNKIVSNDPSGSIKLSPMIHRTTLSLPEDTDQVYTYTTMFRYSSVY